MRKQERTMQQIDPMAAGTSWDVAVTFSLATWTYALFVTLATYRDSQSPVFILIALTALTTAVILHLWSAAPRHAPYSRLNYVIFVVLSITAAAFQIAANGAGSTSMLFEWGPIAVALLFASASGYRSLADQYYAGLAAVLTLLVVLYMDSFDHELSLGAFYFSVSGVALIAIVVLGQASYTSKATRILMAWQKTVNETAVEPGQVDEIEIIGPITRDAREFLVDLLATGRVSEVDTLRARELAGSIRSELVLLSDQTWVERSGCTLHDPEKVLSQLDLSAQSAISALIVGLTEVHVDNLQLSLRIDPLSTRLSCVIQGRESETTFTEGKLRAYVSSFLRVMYVVFEDVRFINNDGQVNVMFYYAK
ncbi:MAG: hypothetical protein RI926_908 [Actinomycetota bacterium]|jgi:hypothetical protein